MWGRRYKTFHHSLKTFHGSPFAPRVGRIRPALILFPSLVSQRSAGCPSGQRERSVKPSALPTLVQIQHLPLPRIGWIRGLNFLMTRYPPIPDPTHHLGIPEKQMEGFGVGDLRWSQHHITGGIHPVIVRG